MVRSARRDADQAAPDATRSACKSGPHSVAPRSDSGPDPAAAADRPPRSTAGGPSAPRRTGRQPQRSTTARYECQLTRAAARYAGNLVLRSVELLLADPLNKAT